MQSTNPKYFGSVAVNVIAGDDLHHIVYVELFHNEVDYLNNNAGMISIDYYDNPHYNIQTSINGTIHGFTVKDNSRYNKNISKLIACIQLTSRQYTVH